MHVCRYGSLLPLPLLLLQHGGCCYSRRAGGRLNVYVNVSFRRDLRARFGRQRSSSSLTQRNAGADANAQRQWTICGPKASKTIAYLVRYWIKLQMSASLRLICNVLAFVGRLIYNYLPRRQRIIINKPPPPSGKTHQLRSNWTIGNTLRPHCSSAQPADQPSPSVQ